MDNRHVAHWVKQPGYVYFIAAGAPPKAVKIGITTKGTLSKRLRAIQSSNHEQVEILGLVAFLEGEEPMARANALEQELHRRFAAHQRFSPGTVGGEWFNPALEILQYISENSQAPDTLGHKSKVGALGAGQQSSAC